MGRRLATSLLALTLLAAPATGQPKNCDEIRAEHPGIECIEPGPQYKVGETFIEDEFSDWEVQMPKIPEINSIEYIANDSSSFVYPGRMKFFRWDKEPDLLVLKTDTRRMQAKMLTRVAAYYEMNDTKGRVIVGEELEEYLNPFRSGMSTIPYGHAYTVSQIVDFFNTVRVQGLELTEHEEDLAYEMLNTLIIGVDDTLFTTRERGAIVTLPQDIHPDSRESLLRHKLHFALHEHDPWYSNIVRSFWDEELDDRDRLFFRTFIEGYGYQTPSLDFVRNKMQAYLADHEYPIEWETEKILNDGKVGTSMQKRQILDYLFTVYCGDREAIQPYMDLLEEQEKLAFDMGEDPVISPFMMQTANPEEYQAMTKLLLYEEGSCRLKRLRGKLVKVVEEHYTMRVLMRGMGSTDVIFGIPDAPPPLDDVDKHEPEVEEAPGHDEQVEYLMHPNPPIPGNNLV